MGSSMHVIKVKLITIFRMIYMAILQWMNTVIKIKSHHFEPTLSRNTKCISRHRSAIVCGANDR